MVVANPVIEGLTDSELGDFVERAVLLAIRRAAQTSPFHQWMYAKAGIDGEQLDSLDAVRRNVPFTEKRDVLSFQEAHRDVDSGRRRSIRQVHLTSGTSGVGREAYPRSGADLAGLGIPGAYEFVWAGVRPGDSLMLTIPYSQTMAGPYFQDACLAAGVVPINAFSGSTVDRLHDLARFGCSGLSATPSYLHRLRSEALRLGIVPRRDLPSLRAVFLSGEAYAVSWAREQAGFWGATLAEGWGATQTLGVAMCTCERGAFVAEEGALKHGVLHGLDHRCWIEILDPQGNPVAPGESGEIVVTTLRPSAQPSIRFRMGDRAQLLEPGSCGCGRRGACYLAGSIGRVDDMLKIRGMNVWPEAVDGVVLNPPVLDYRARITNGDDGKELVDLTIAVEDGTSASTARTLLTRIRHELKQVAGISVDVSLAPIGQMPEELFKSRRWSDERAARTEGTGE